MSYETLEVGNYDGAPVTLYQFQIANTFWRFASARRTMTLVGQTWTSATISDDGLVFSGNADDDELTIRMAGNAFTDLYVSNPPTESAYLTIRRNHHGDTEAPVVWVGTVKSVKRLNQIEFEVVCRTITSSLNRLGLRLCFSRNCPHTLYDVSCGVNKNGYAITRTVTAISGSNVTFSGVSFEVGFFDGGYIEYAANGLTERVAIESYQGNTFAALTPPEGLIVGSTITLYPGCDRTTLTCQTKFNNLANYGGFPQLPNKSPFDFDPIF